MPEPNTSYANIHIDNNGNVAISTTQPMTNFTVGAPSGIVLQIDGTASFRDLIGAGTRLTAASSGGVLVPINLSSASLAVSGTNLVVSNLEASSFSTNLKAEMRDNSFSDLALRNTVSQVNRGPVVIRNNSDVYDVYIKAGQYEWSKWSISQSAAGRRHGIKEIHIENWFNWAPLMSSSTAWRTAGSNVRYSVNTYAIGGIQPYFTDGCSCDVTITGEGPLFMYLMARSGTGSSGTVQAALVSGPTVDYDNWELYHHVQSTDSYAPAFSRIHPYLPYGTYTVRLTHTSSGASYPAEAFPIALGFANGTPYEKANTIVKHAPTLAGFCKEDGSSYTSIVATDMTSGGLTNTVNHDSPKDFDTGGPYYFVVGSPTGHHVNKIELEFIVANSGGGTLKVYYWNGSALAEASLHMNTMGSMNNDGYVSFYTPTDIVANTVNSHTGYHYYLRSSTSMGGVQFNNVWLHSQVPFYQEVKYLNHETNSELEMVTCRYENGPTSNEQDMGGGHDNEARTSFDILADGVSIVSSLTNGKAQKAQSIVFKQELSLFTNFQVTGSAVAQYSLRHEIGSGGIAVDWYMTYLAQSTLNPFYYPYMLPSNINVFSHINWVYSDRIVTTTLPTTGEVSKVGGEAVGAFFTSTEHKYRLGISTQFAQESAYNYRSGDTWFVLTINPYSKIYCHGSGNTNGYITVPANHTIFGKSFYYCY